MGRTMGRPLDMHVPNYYKSRYNLMVEAFRNITELNLRVPHAAESDTVGGRATGAEVVELLHASHLRDTASLAAARAPGS